MRLTAFSTAPLYANCRLRACSRDSRGVKGAELGKPKTPWWRFLQADILSEVRVGAVVVPRHRWRRDLSARGVYRALEYRVKSLSLNGISLTSTRDLHSAAERATVLATLTPLRRGPRRHAPVTVSLGEAVVWSYEKDLACSLAASVLFALSVLGACTVLTRSVSVYAIGSCSMTPTLQVGDALVVEKLSLRDHPAERGEIVLFRAPPALRALVARGGHGSPRRRDLFVKRVTAVAGDTVTVKGHSVIVNGKVVEPAPEGAREGERIVPRKFLFVTGDNPRRSLDSRYWGLLPEEYVVGRPVARIFPVQRFQLDL